MPSLWLLGIIMAGLPLNLLPWLMTLLSDLKRRLLAATALGSQVVVAPAPRQRRRLEPELDSALRAACEQALDERLAQASQRLKQSWPRPTLRFTQRGKAAGTAHLQTWEIRLNPLLLVDNRQSFLHEVIPHELAHLLVFALHGRCAPHGREWKRMMQQVFELPGRVTHQLDISKVEGPQFSYRCACRDHSLSLRRHNALQRGKSRYLCRHCGVPLQAVC